MGRSEVAARPGRPQQIVPALALGCLGQRINNELGHHHSAILVRLQRADDVLAAHLNGVAAQVDASAQAVDITDPLRRSLPQRSPPTPRRSTSDR